MESKAPGQRGESVEIAIASALGVALRLCTSVQSKHTHRHTLVHVCSLLLYSIRVSLIILYAKLSYDLGVIILYD